MIVSAHQPHFLPWLGYFNKVINSDIFIWLNNVQYRKNYFQNRTKIKCVNDSEMWLTLPVHVKLGDLISKVPIAEEKWKKRIINTIHMNYSKAAHYESISEIIYSKINSMNNFLLDHVNYELFTEITKLLEINTKIIRVEELNIENIDPNLRLIEICKKVNASEYIAGKGGKNYMDTSLFSSEGIEIIWQDFRFQEIYYKQLGKIFVPGLSIIDPLMNIGIENTKKLLFNSWKVKN